MTTEIVNLITLEEKVEEANIKGLVEVDWIMRNDYRVCDFTYQGRMITREEIREALTDYVNGCKLPHELSWLRFTPTSTKQKPQRYLALDTANTLTRMFARLEAQVEEEIYTLGIISTAVVE